MTKILLVDDEQHIREDLGKRLKSREYAVYTASNVEEARKIILCEDFDYAIIDLKLDFTSEYGGIKIFNFAKRNHPKTKAIVLSAYPFEEVRNQIKKELKGELTPEKILEEIEQDYICKGGGENYILAVLDKLGKFEKEKEREKKKCFVIMPFSSTKTCSEDEWSEVFERVIKPAVEKSGFNYECCRAKLCSGSIIEHILDNLNRSDLVIADITDRNPNVLYELGVRHTLGGATVVIAQNKKDVPFDLLPYFVINYGWKTEKERDKFKTTIKEAIEFFDINPDKTGSPVQKYLNPLK